MAWWQACVGIRGVGVGQSKLEKLLRLEAADETHALAQINMQMRADCAQHWWINLLAPMPEGPFQFGQITAGEFLFACGCRMDGTGSMTLCLTHQWQGSVGDDAIAEAVAALGLLRQTRREYTCETCGAKAKAPPFIGEFVGRFTFPRDWESEEWSRKLPFPSPTGSDYEHGRAVFCSRRCRGEWLIKTDGTLRRP